MQPAVWRSCKQEYVWMVEKHDGNVDNRIIITNKTVYVIANEDCKRKAQ